MGETIKDRLLMLQTLANRNPQPGLVPINQLMAMPGTPPRRSGKSQHLGSN